LNIQTERLENHTARFTIAIDAARLDSAKQEAARKLSRRVNIPGFRKGKAPYKIVLQYFGEGAIIEDAVEILGNKIYAEALTESQIDPYGPGELEDFKLEPEPTFVFVVPLQPAVTLNDYREARMEFVLPEVTDDQVNRALTQIQEQFAVIEESSRPVELGNRVAMELYAKTIVEEGESAEAPAEEKADDHEDHDGHDHDHGLEGNGEEFIHEHNAVLVLNEENEQPAPGFREALVGAAVGESREFELSYPDDSAEYEDLAGKRAKFKVVIKKIENMTLPAMNDDLAVRATEKQEKPLATLLELRIKVREDLQKAMENEAKSKFSAEVLDMMVEKATIGYPDVLLNDQTDEYLERMDRDLRRQGLTLDDYMRITNKDRDALKVDYREIAIKNVRRSLVLREVMRAEKIDVTEAAVSEEIEKMLAQFGEQAEQLRSAVDTPSMRQNVRNELLERGVLDRIVEIGKGEAPALDAAAETPSGEANTEG